MEPAPRSPSDTLKDLGITYRIIQDEETARLIHSLGWEFHFQSPFETIRKASFEDTLETYLRATKPWEDSLCLIGFFDITSGDLLGSVLLSIAPLWYDQSSLGAYELCLGATPKGSRRGISRAATMVLRGLVDSGFVQVVEAGSAMSPRPSQLENAYRKAGFSTFKSFVMEESRNGRPDQSSEESR